MAYNIIDLIDRAIDTGNKVIEIYIDMNKEYDDINSFKIFSKIFMKYEKEKIDYYHSLKIRLNKRKNKRNRFIYI